MQRKQIKPARIIKNFEKTGCKEERNRAAAALGAGGGGVSFFFPSDLDWFGLQIFKN